MLRAEISKIVPQLATRFMHYGLTSVGLAATYLKRTFFVEGVACVFADFRVAWSGVKLMDIYRDPDEADTRSLLLG